MSYYSGVAGFGDIFGLQFIIISRHAGQVVRVLEERGYLPPDSKTYDFGGFRQVTTGVLSMSREEISELEEIASANGMLFCARKEELAARISGIDDPYLKDVAAICYIL